MNEFVIIWDWMGFAIRWLHVIAGIAWIGSSFYFIALDLGLRRAPDLPAGAHGEEWQVHGGGFYHIRKYLVAPAALPEHLTWFKWESYMTWISGFALLAVVYYAGAELYLVDAAVWDAPAWLAILVSVGSLALGWILYDLICRSRFGADNRRLMLLLYLILVAAAWGYAQLFTGRAALLHLGALTATVMTGNVFFVIMPNQRIVVADLRAGRVPDAKYGRIAKQRSTHNNYLTLPVIFLMLSNHYPLAFATPYSWAIASLVFLMGVTIRHYFNTRHARRAAPNWTWGATAILFIAIIWLSTLPAAPGGGAADDSAGVRLSPFAARLASAEEFPAVRDVVLGRCSMCHAAEPFYDGIRRAPRGVLLETGPQIAAYGREIYLQAGRSHAMPPANVSFMEEEERALIVAWFEQARR